MPSLFHYQNISVFAVYLQVSGLGCEGVTSDFSDELYLIRLVLISKSTAKVLLELRKCAANPLTD